MQPTRIFVGVVLSALTLFVLAPIFAMFFVPLVKGDSSTFAQAATLFDWRQLPLAGRSFVLATGTTLLTLLMGIPLAFLLEKTDLPGQRVFWLLTVIPLLIPPYIHAIVWNNINPVLTRWGMADIHCLGGAIWVLALSFFPVITILTVSGLKSIDSSLEEAGFMAMGRWQTLRKITLPLVRPHVLCGAVFVFIFALVDFGVADILRLKVYPLEIFVQFSAFYDDRAAMILAIPLIIVGILLVIMQKRSMKDRIYVQMAAGVSPITRILLGRLKIFGISFCSCLFFVAVGLPVVVLMIAAGPLTTYLKMFSLSMHQLIYSLVLAGSGAFFTLILSFALAYLIEQTKVRGRKIVEFLSYFPLAVPGVAVGIGLITIWNKPVVDYIYSSSFIVIIGYMAHYLPFGVLILSSGMKQLNPRLIEAAWLQERRRIPIVRRIVLPLLGPSLIIGFFLVFILALGDLGTTLLVIPPGRETVPIKIYNLLHYGADQMVAALCLILLATILALAALFFVGYRKATRSRGAQVAR